MSSERRYPRRLIEVDLPIKEISAHARRDRRVKVGHISRLHMWWARRPLAACRAVMLGALWPDPVDPLCPERFRAEAAKTMKEFRDRRGGKQRDWSDSADVRAALLDFIADFANWDNLANAAYLETARRLVQVAHESLGGEPGTRPLVIDPFAGGGTIPVEALRVGADAFASDLNPVAVLLNKVLLEYIPQHGQRLADAVRYWGQRLHEEATASLARYYPPHGDAAIPLAYVWARTLRCEGPACGFTFPLLSQLSIVPKKGVCLELDCSPEQAPNISVSTSTRGKRVAGTVRGGAVTCPKCDFTIPASRYRERSARGELGRRLVMVVLRNSRTGQREYRSPTAEDVRAEELAVQAVRKIEQNWNGPLPPFPHEDISRDEPRRLNILAYGFTNWRDLYTHRQLLAIHTIGELLNALPIAAVDGDRGQETITPAVRTCLALAVSNTIHYNTAFSTYLSDGMISAFIQSSSIPMRADFAEANPLQEWYVGGIAYQLERVAEVVEECAKAALAAGRVYLRDAAEPLLPDHAAQALVTDPPYYYAIPYADLSDLFYVWLKRLLSSTHPELFSLEVTDKDREATQSLHHSASPSLKDSRHYEQRLREALGAQRMVVDAGGIAVVVFANAETQAWEALLGALIGAGWVVTAAWPIDTERAERMLASRQRTLASSVHLACRPRSTDSVGDWRSILRDLPIRLHEWMPRLAKEGVVGADAIFACLGPALEIFSRYSRVEKASGEQVELREYLEQVWAAVAREALSMIFEDADATGLEEDARLTAMWLWTLSTSANGRGNGRPAAAGDDEDSAASGDEEQEESPAKGMPVAGFPLEFDAARKIAQGLGAHIEDLGRVVEIKGDQARLLSVAERTNYLFGKDQVQRTNSRRPKKAKQLTLFEELEAAEKDAGWGDVGLPPAGETALDRVHQSMVLFAAGRGEALKRFLVEEGVGRDGRFWRLAQSLSALYPVGTEEKRWVDGVLARKKGLGFG